MDIKKHISSLWVLFDPFSATNWVEQTTWGTAASIDTHELGHSCMITCGLDCQVPQYVSHTETEKHSFDMYHYEIGRLTGENNQWGAQWEKGIKTGTLPRKPGRLTQSKHHFFRVRPSVCLCALRCTSSAISQAILHFHIITYWIWTVKYDKCKCMNNHIVLTVDEIWHLGRNNPELLSHLFEKTFTPNYSPYFSLNDVCDWSNSLPFVPSGVWRFINSKLHVLLPLLREMSPTLQNLRLN